MSILQPRPETAILVTSISVDDPLIHAFQTLFKMAGNEYKAQITQEGELKTEIISATHRIGAKLSTKNTELTEGGLHQTIDLKGGRISSGTHASDGGDYAQVSSSKVPTNRALIVSQLGIVTIQLKNILRSMHFQVFVAKTPQEAKQEFAKRDYDRVIVDIQDGSPDSLHMLETLRTSAVIAGINCEFIVIASPNNNDNELRQYLSQIGCEWIIVKQDGWQNQLFEGIRPH